MYNYTLIRMKKVFFILIPAVILSLLSCSPKKPAEEKLDVNTVVEKYIEERDHDLNLSNANKPAEKP